MTCRFGVPLDEDDLLSALDGTESAAVAAHLSQCTYCAERRDRLGQFEERLKARVHPSPQALLEFHFSLLNPDENERITSHLRRCHHCQAILDEYAKESPLPKQAPQTIRRSPKPAGSTYRPPIRLHPPMAAGVPVLGSIDGLTAGAEGVSLFLSIVQEDEIFTVHGHVVAEDQQKWSSAVAAISLQADMVGMVTLNELGQFAFQGLSKGVYKLRISAESGEVLIFEPLNVG